MYETDIYMLSFQNSGFTKHFLNLNPNLTPNQIQYWAELTAVLLSALIQNYDHKSSYLFITFFIDSKPKFSPSTSDK